MQITLNGDPYEVAAPLSVSELLARLAIDARRVAVEHNLVVLKRSAFDATIVQDGDSVEIVNFVGGGSGPRDDVHHEKKENTKSIQRGHRGFFDDRR